MAETNKKLRIDTKKAAEIKKSNMAYCLPAKDHKALQDAAYQDFSQNGSEGKTHRIYLDCLGNPTVGVGHLIMPKKGLGNKKVEEAYRQKYMQLDLRDPNGNPLSKEEKYSQFSSILSAMQQKSFKTSGGVPNYVNYPAVGKLSEAGVKAAFNQDYDYWYNRVKGRFPDLDKYPLSLQLSLTHCGFAGALKRIKNTGDYVDIARQVAKVRSTKICSTKERQMAQMASRQCQYLADNGLSPLSSSRNNLMAALNVAEPTFTNPVEKQDQLLADNGKKPLQTQSSTENEQSSQTAQTNEDEQDNIGSGSMLRALACGDGYEDLLGKLIVQVFINGGLSNRA